MTKKQQLGIIQNNLPKKSKILKKRKVSKMLAVMEAQQIAGPSSTNAVTPECSNTNATHAQEFLTSGRTGRRNALPDILNEHALVTSSDLPARLQSLSTKDPKEITSKDKEEASTSSS